jgi:exonuclease III
LQFRRRLLERLDEASADIVSLQEITTTEKERCPPRARERVSPERNPKPDPKFDHKFARFERFKAHARALMDSGKAVVLAGDPERRRRPVID